MSEFGASGLATLQRARVGDSGVLEPEIGELVRVKGIIGAKFTFKGYGSDKGGDYAIIIGGLHGHRTERCVVVDRLQSLRHRRRTRSVISNASSVGSE